MRPELNEGDLLRLGRVRRWLVLGWWSALLVRQQYYDFPFPMKLAVDISLILMVVLWLVPMPPDMPAVGLPLMWLGSYLVAFMWAATSPRRKREPVHWVK